MIDLRTVIATPLSKRVLEILHRSSRECCKGVLKGTNKDTLH